MKRLTDSAITAFLALQDDRVLVTFGLDDNDLMSAYRDDNVNLNIATMRSLWRRGYVAKVRNITDPKFRFIEVWVCGLTDTGKQAFSQAE